MFKKFRKYLIVAAGLTAFAMAGCSGSDGDRSYTNENPNPFTPKGTVTGVLIDRETQAPISNANIYILDKHTSTNDQGMFTIKNVPANTAVGNEPSNSNGSDCYNVVIDMTNVNNEIKSYNSNANNTVKKAYYPAFAYNYVEVKYDSLGDTGNYDNPPTVNSTNHDTPVDGFVANMMPSVGRLEGSIWVQVVKDSDWTSVANVPVRLYSTGSDNSTTGEGLHIVQTVNTDANGIAKFEAVEVMQSFTARAASADETLKGSQNVISFGKGITNKYLAQSSGLFSPLVLSAIDGQAPFITFTSPENLSDIAAGATTNVEFNFSEPIAATPYAMANTESKAQGKYGLWNDVVVNYIGPKAPAFPGSGIPFTLTWSADMKKLTVTLATVVGSKYVVAISDALYNGNSSRPWLQDAAGNYLGAVDLNDRAFFTTAGGDAVTAAPVMIKSTGDILSWLPVANATKYRLYKRTTTNGIVGPWVEVTTQSNSSYPVTGIPYSSGENRNTYDFKVVGISTNLLAGPDSNVINFADTTGASITSYVGGSFNGLAGGNIAVGGAAGVKTSYTVVVTFSEGQFAGEALNPAKWAITRAVAADTGGAYVPNGTPALDIDPAITGITVNTATAPTQATLTIAVTQNATANGTWDPQHLLFTYAGTDISLNAIKATANAFDLAGGIQ